MTAPLLVKQTPAQARATAAKMLIKHGATPGKIRAQVAALFDHSGSTEFDHRRFYTGGYIGGLVSTTLGVGLTLDDNGNVPCVVFANDAHRVADFTQGNIETFVQRELLPWAKRGGGTNLATGMRELMRTFDHSSPDVGLAMVFTDGEASDARAVEQLMREYSSKPVFWQFIGIHVPGDRPDFGLLENLDNLSGRVVDNANFFDADVTRVTPEDIMGKMLTEFLRYPALVAANSARVHW